MPNTFLTPKIIAQEALMVLENQLTMANLVHRDYSKEFVKVGDSITIRKPARFSAKNFTGQVHSQNITEGSAVVKMDRFRDVTVEVGAKELTLDIKDFSTQVVAPALSAIAQAIDQDLLAVGIQMAAKSATVSAKPSITDIAGVGKALDMSNAPLQNRRLVLPAEIKYKYNTLDNFAKQCYAGTSQALRDAEIGKVYTCETYSTENCPHSAADKPGTVTEYKVTGTADTTKLNVTEGKPEAGTIAAGDQLIVNGYTYTVTEALTLAGGAGTLKVDQNLPADIETATPVKVINKAHALGFHRNGIALVTRQLELPMGASKAHIASANGLAVRVVMDYDPQTKKDTVSFDCIYGIKELDTSLLVDFS